MKKRFSTLCAALFLLAGCSEDSGKKDYLSIAGGGLVFNYRYAQLTMVVVARQVSALPEGSAVEAEFQLPGGTAREKVRRPAQSGSLTYKLESSYLRGVRMGETMKVAVVLRSRTGEELDRDETQFTSDIDQSSLPAAPLVIPDEPGYVPVPGND